jgi:hypothetical protein
MMMNHSTYSVFYSRTSVCKELKTQGFKLCALGLKLGGGYRSRTDDPLRARQVL